MKSEETIIELFGKMPYKPLVEKTKDFAIFHLDTKGRILSWNLGAQLIFGYNKDEIIGKKFSLLYIAKDREHSAPDKELKKAAKNGRAEDKRWHLRKDNSYFYADGVTTALTDENGKLIGYAKIARDDTVRKQMKESLLESEERYRIVAETASDAIISIDQQSTILFINRAATRIFGYEIEQMIGQSLTMLMPEYLRHVHEAGINRYLETGKRHLSWEHIEVPGLHKDGHEFPLELSFGEFKRNHTHVFIGIARDISERKQIESEREKLLQREQEARRQADEANRLKDEFLAVVSHELRTPLNAILGWSNLLDSGKLDAQASADALETIQRNARSQAQLIDDLLDTSRIITGNLRLDIRTIDLSRVIMTAINNVSPAMEAKEIQLQTMLDPQASLISGDPDRLQQIIWNLLTNAVKFTAQGGTVQVRLEKTNSHIVIAVSDTGKGIEPEFLPYVFDRFRQSDASTTRSHGGLGLGLAIVRQLVELHGGTVSVQSAGKGEGSTFVVKLPLLHLQKENVNEIQPKDSNDENIAVVDCPSDLTGLRILAVDDDADSRELMNMMITSCGANVTIADSADKAFRLIESKRFDVIVSDIGMPEEDGFSLIRRVRGLPMGQGGNTPAIALTAYTRTEDRQQAIHSGFQMHISKPFEHTDLITAIANLTVQTKS
jgi:PAS domain S-box-containing protein